MRRAHLRQKEFHRLPATGNIWICLQIFEYKIIWSNLGTCEVGVKHSSLLVMTMRVLRYSLRTRLYCIGVLECWSIGVLIESKLKVDELLVKLYGTINNVLEGSNRA